MLWGEPSEPVVEEKSGDAKSFKASLAEAKPKLSDQGLRPGGAGLVENATVLGLYFRVAF